MLYCCSHPRRVDREQYKCELLNLVLSAYFPLRKNNESHTQVVEPGTETCVPDGTAGEILLGGPLIMKGRKLIHIHMTHTVCHTHLHTCVELEECGIEKLSSEERRGDKS